VIEKTAAERLFAQRLYERLSRTGQPVKHPHQLCSLTAL